VKLEIENFSNESYEHIAALKCRNTCVNENDMAIASVIRDIIKLKEKSVVIMATSNFDFDSLLNEICTN
jgi:hypothetical protein